MKGTIAAAAVLLGLLAAAVGVTWWALAQLGDVQMGLHGYIALTIGVVVTFALGAGLMWLAYFSHKRGYDEQPGHRTRTE